MVTTEEKRKMGRTSKASGAEFERRVRIDLEEKKWIVSKWMNNVEFREDFMTNEEVIKAGFGDDSKIPIIRGKLIKAKPKFVYNPQLRMRVPQGISQGFPDFIIFRNNSMATARMGEIPISVFNGKSNYQIIAVEVKTNGKLDKIEKEKCKWLLENNIFTKILIARKTKVKNRIKIVYDEFNYKEEKWNTKNI